MGTFEHRHAAIISVVHARLRRGFLARFNIRDSQEALVLAGPRRHGVLTVGCSRQLGVLDGPRLAAVRDGRFAK